ncbi:MAG TPA: inner membrane CreD family protein, partial [Puia sp.]|nr:inner membrane CreD family protein [Puia sp.]
MENVISQFWNRNRIVLKSFWIGFLVLLLLIPTFLINGLVNERQDRERAAVAEISSRWAGAQTVTGPVIGIPYLETVSDNAGASKPEKRWAYFLPAK